MYQFQLVNKEKNFTINFPVLAIFNVNVPIQIQMKYEVGTWVPRAQ